MQIAYADGLTDPVLFHICLPLRDLLHRPRQATDAMFVEGIQVAIAAHLLANYTIDRWRPPEKSPSLDPRRLQRVLDYIEASLAADIRLEEMAAHACLSPFHFSRLFREATGLSPHRYVIDRRVQAARQELARNNMSLVEIALGFGFGSQANFTRVFRMRRVSLRDSIANSAAVRSIATLITGAEDSARIEHDEAGFVNTLVLPLTRQ